MKNDKFVIAIDSFKGSATSKQAGEWVAQGLKNVLPDIQTVVVPIADGGEGTLDALVASGNGRVITEVVEGPLGAPVKARFGLLDEQTAIIEMAESSGLNLTSGNPEDALIASTYGVGQLILAALDQGAQKILIGIGGSATTDGGTGMAQALGVKMVDANGRTISRGAAGLGEIATIATDELDARIQTTDFYILSDVTNPLVGENGATFIYGPQKGIPLEKRNEIDENMAHYGALIKEQVGIDILQLPGAGAAGGLGGALVAFTNATMHKGIETILSLLHFETILQGAALCITGEGRMDNQSIHGKAPVGIAKLAKAANVPVAAIVASRAEDLSKVYEAGIDLVLSIINRPMSLEEAMAEVEQNTKIAGETLMRAFLLGKEG